MPYSAVLNESDLLARVSTYHLDRDSSDCVIVIEVSELLAGTPKHKFIAQPFANVMKSPSNDGWIGKGSTEDEALRDCLAKIKSVSSDKIMAAARERRQREENP